MGTLKYLALACVCSAASVGVAQATQIAGFGSPAGEPGIINAVVEDFETLAPGATGAFSNNGVTYTGTDTRGIAGPNPTASPMYVDRRVALTTTAIWPGPYPPGYEVEAGLVYFVTDGDLNSVGQGLSNGEETLAIDANFDPTPYTVEFRFDFAAPVEYFAFNLGGMDNVWELSAYDGGGGLIDSMVIGPQGPDFNDGAYFGLSDAGGIAYAVLRDMLAPNWPTGELVVIDNFTTANLNGVAPVPLPAALPMLLGAMALFGFAGWRKSRAA